MKFTIDEVRPIVNLIALTATALAPNDNPRKAAVVPALVELRDRNRLYATVGVVDDNANATDIPAVVPGLVEAMVRANSPPSTTVHVSVCASL